MLLFSLFVLMRLSAFCIFGNVNGKSLAISYMDSK